MKSLTVRTLSWVQRQASYPWRWLTCLVVPFGDYLLPVLPANTALMGLAAARPNRWRLFAFAFALANALGAVLVAFLLGLFGQDALSSLLGEFGSGELWNRSHQWLTDYGLLVLVPLSMSVFPPRIAVLVTAVAGIHPVLIGSCVLVGRIAPMAGFAWLGAHSPKWARRFGPTRALLDDMDQMARNDDELMRAEPKEATQVAP